jgi:serine/threonine protein kinase
VYELLTGRHPFGGGGPSEILLNITTRTPPSARITNSDLPKELDATFMRGLAKDLARRHQSAASLSAELRRGVAALDVRSGERRPQELLPLDEEERSRAWILYVLVAAAVGVLWFLLR